MNKILVTGAAGFIGFHLSQSLVKQNNQVIGIDNLNDYYDVSLKKARLQELEKLDNFQFHFMDLHDRNSIDKLFKQEKFDIVVNLAAQAGVRYSLENPHVYAESNVVGFLNILEGCRHNPVKHLVFASSSSVYGMNSKIPFSTNDPVDCPVSLYAATKRANELMAYTYSHLYKIPSTGLRFFTVYGPWGRPDMALFLFTKAILGEKPIRVFNYGKMQRDFTYIDDIVVGIEKVMEKIPSGVPPYKLYNIGNNQPVELLHLIEVIEKSLRKTAIKEFLPMQPGDVLTTYADVDDLITDVGFSPKTPIEKGVEKFVNWYRNYYQV
ncbi:NAD-dependent epimerase [Geminocystis sp. NIES-3709]|uniref:NAD-dependent epimerase n=1 Tax=Geminocystis sp. NIES-3709 TaxID=1617448 RepID=UPI0005FC5EB0|nr:NAD-dependent epimerase [Geminocystis sp. NIES-3709]BAQ65349.1 dTDP-glucose 4,6-dehydratase [Geminocystis sp. NIES-3709]